MRLMPGVSVYANASLNDTHYKHSHTQLANAPTRTAAFGPIMDMEGFSAALLMKYIGPQYGQDTPADAFPVKSYITADLALGYTLGILNGRKIDIRVNVNNIFNDHSIIGLNTTAGDGNTGLYWTNPGRSVFFTLAASL
jgi:outer membrane receptor protein involved in Fe transport